MKRWPWIERKFSFDYPAEKFPDLLERWRGAPARLEERLRGVPREALTGNNGSGWSILQNIGHLVDLGYLATTRLRQILAGETALIAADMTNQKTQIANHNSRELSDLLAEFRRDRLAGVQEFEAVSCELWGKGGVHPRLKQQMRIVDIPYFDSEHDDYHLARIGELLRAWRAKEPA